MDLGIANRRALVLASSRGLGFGIARAFVGEGVDVMISGRDADRLAAACNLLREVGGGRAEALAVDLADPSGIDRLCAESEAKFGGIDILVSNCGGPPMAAALEPDDAMWRAQFESMVLTPIRAARHVVPGMQQRRWGRVIAITASTVAQPMPEMVLSNTLRAALTNWCKTLANEVAADNVTVNTLIPGRINTERIEELNAAEAARRGVDPEIVQAAGVAAVPAKRDGDVMEFAAAALFLASDAGSYMTGGALRVDGGMIRSTMA